MKSPDAKFNKTNSCPQNTLDNNIFIMERKAAKVERRTGSMNMTKTQNNALGLGKTDK